MDEVFTGESESADSYLQKKATELERKGMYQSVIVSGPFLCPPLGALLRRQDDRDGPGFLGEAVR